MKVPYPIIGVFKSRAGEDYFVIRYEDAFSTGRFLVPHENGRMTNDPGCDLQYKTRREAIGDMKKNLVVKKLKKNPFFHIIINDPNEEYYSVVSSK